MNQILSIYVFLPILGALISCFLPKQNQSLFKWFTVTVSFIGLMIAVYLYFETSAFNGFLIETNHWFSFSVNGNESYQVNYALKLDGFNKPLVILASLIQFVAAISSFEIQQKIKGYHALFLLLSGSILGCFLAKDAFLFFVFFEFMLLPMYFLIGIWGGKNREYASIKFFIYTLLGSIFILISIIALSSSYYDYQEMYKNAQFAFPDIDFKSFKSELTESPGFAKEIGIVHTFDIDQFANHHFLIKDSFLGTPIKGIFDIRGLFFILMFVGFAIKLPLVPLHTWLPDAHVEAPTAISVVLAGILLKVGSYGLIKLAYLPFHDVVPFTGQFVAGAATIAIVYGAFNALAQNDFKKMIAYSSVSHMGFVLLGTAALNELGWQGAVYQMVSHGLLSGMLFIIVGVIYGQSGYRTINHFQGLANKMPIYTFFTAIAFFASLGLPFFSGFIGEFFCLSGAFVSTQFSTYWVYLALFGVLLGVIYFIWTFKRMFLGNFWTNYPHIDYHDLDNREILMLALLAIPVIFLGLFPSFLNQMTSFPIHTLLTVFD